TYSCFHKSGMDYYGPASNYSYRRTWRRWGGAMKHLSLIMLVFAMVFVVTVQKSSAQDVAVDAVPSEVAKEATPVETAALPETPTVSIPEQVNASTLPSYYEPSPVDLNEIPSLFFTKWEHDLLIEARHGATTRPVVDGEDPQDTEIFALPDDPAAIAGAPGE